MNPLSKVTGALSHPMQTAGSLAGHALGAATASVRTTTRVVAWAAKQGRGGTRVSERPGATAAGKPSAAPAPAPGTSLKDAPLARNEVTPDPRAPQPPTTASISVEESPATKTEASVKTTKAQPEPSPAKATARTARKATPSAKVAPRSRKTAAKKAPSAKAATAGPALAKLAKEGESSIPTPTPPGDSTQPEPQPLLDPATVKAVKSETDVLRRAADPHKD